MSGTISFQDFAGGSSQPAAAPGVSFADFANAPPVPAQQADAPKSGMLANIGAALQEGAAGIGNALSDPFGNLIGKPAASLFVSAHDYLAPKFGGQRFSPEDRAFFTGDQVAQPGTAAVNALDQAGGAPTPDQVQPNGAAQQYVRSAVSGAVQGLAAGPGAAGALIGAASGVGGQAAADAAPDWLKPAASLAGALAAGGGAGLSVAAGAGLVNATRDAADAALRPMVGKAAPIMDTQGQPIPMSAVTGNAADTAPITAKPGQADMAGAQLRAGATDPVAAQAALANPAPPVAGFKPTTYQATNDPGLGQMERAAATAQPDVFIPRREQNQAATLGAVQSIAPAEADPAAVGQFVRQQLDQSAAAMGGNPAAAPGDMGDALRAPLDAANQAAKAATSRLYDAVDPDGTLAVNARSIRAAATDIIKARSQYAAPMTPDETRIFGQAQTLPASLPFRDLQGLRGQITDAIATARSPLQPNQPAVARLSQLLASVHGAMADTAEEAMNGPQGGAIQARLNALPEATAQTAAGAEPGMGSGGGTVAAQPGISGTANGVSGSGGTNLQSGVGTVGRPDLGGDSALATGSADAIGAQQPAPLTPNWDADASERLNAANASHADRMATFGKNAPGVGPVLRQGDRGGFAMQPSQVPGKLLGPGPAYPERVAAYFKGGGSPEAARDYLASSFRAVAEGGKDAGNWIAQHQPALEHFPDLAAKFQAYTALKQSAAARFLGAGDPATTIGKVLRGDTATADMAQLAKLTAGNQAARDGLKAAIRDHIARDLTNGAGDTLKSEGFQAFYKKTAPALAKVFSPAEIENIRKISDASVMIERSIKGTKLAGGSNTAQDTHGGTHSLLGSMILAEMVEKVGNAAGAVTGAGVGAVLGGPVGALSGAGAGLASTAGIAALKAARDNGVAGVQNLVEIAMAHPELARTLMARVPANPRAGIMQIFRRQIGAITGTAALSRRDQ